MLRIFLIILFCLFFQKSHAWEPNFNFIKVIVGQSPGGGNEFAFRGIQKQLEKRNPKNKFLIEHHPGSDNVVAMNHFAKLKPNGEYILVVVQASGFVAAPVAYQSELKIDPMKYTFVTPIARSPMAFIVSTDSKIKTVPELIFHLKNKKNKFNIGSSGNINLLTYHYFLKELGVSTEQAQVVQYQSPTEASVAVASKEIDMAIVPLAVPKSLIEAGKILLLAHTGSSKIKGLENIELIKDHVNGLEIEATWSVFLPPNTPTEIVDWYVKEFAASINDDDAKKYFETNWSQVSSKTIGPAGLRTEISELRKRWLPIAYNVFKK